MPFSLSSSGRKNPPVDVESSWTNIIAPELLSLFANSAPDYARYSAIYSAVFAITSFGGDRWDGQSILYKKLDEFLATITRDVLLRAPVDDGIVDYYVAAYAQYIDALQKLKHQFRPLELKWVSREKHEKGGWLSSQPLWREQMSVHKWKGCEEEACRMWGYTEGGGPTERAAAVSRGEAGSELTCVVSPHSLGLRRWRVEVVQPLLAGESAIAAAANDLRKCGLLRKVIQTWLAVSVTVEQKENLSRIQQSLVDVGVVAEDPTRVGLARFLTTA